MKLELLGYVINVLDFEHEDPLSSPHTGNKLERIHFNITLEEELMIDDFMNGLSDVKEGNIFSTDDEHHVIKEYRLLNSSYSYRGNFGSSSVTFQMKLEEVERFNIKSLIIRDIEMDPYYYDEEYDTARDAIIITARVTLTKDRVDDLLGFESGDIYFPVIRSGISDEKLEMRFGKVLWSETEENIKLNLIIVEKSYDENDKHPSRLFEPELSNIMSTLDYTKKLNNELIDLLISKNVVSLEEIDALKMKSETGKRKAYHNFYQVKDIDDFCE